MKGEGKDITRREKRKMEEKRNFPRFGRPWRSWRAPGNGGVEVVKSEGGAEEDGGKKWKKWGERAFV